MYPTTGSVAGQPVSIFNPVVAPVTQVSGTGLTGSIPAPTTHHHPYTQAPQPTWNDPPSLSSKKKVYTGMA